MITKHAKRMGIAAGTFFFLTLCLFVAASVYVYVQGTTLRTKAQLVADHAAQRQAQAQLNQALTDSADERAALGAYVLTEAEVIDFLAQVESDADRLGVTLATDSLKPTTGKSFDTLLVQFSITGDESSVHAMIQALETLPYPSAITRLSLTAGGAEGVETTGSVDVVVSLQKP